MSGSTARPRAPDWTEAKEAQLRAMMPDHRLVDIARAMGQTWAATQKKCARMGCSANTRARDRSRPRPAHPRRMRLAHGMTRRHCRHFIQPCPAACNYVSKGKRCRCSRLERTRFGDQWY